MWYHNVGFKETSRNKKTYLEVFMSTLIKVDGNKILF